MPTPLSQLDPELSADVSTAGVKFHLSLNVADLAKSVAFYQVLFDIAPAKRFADYAKFELSDPPLVLSLEPQPHAAGGALNHLGFRLNDGAGLVEAQRRLELAGIATTREDGVECCYARQTKFWVTDPDRNNWEIYVLEEDAPHRGDRVASNQHGPSTRADHADEACAGTSPVTSTKAMEWEHQLGQPFPRQIPLADGAADRVLLRGTFNEPLSEDERKHIFAEADRVLRAGGVLSVHGLVADSVLKTVPSLPGPAAAVRYVPTSAQIIDAVQDARFLAIRLEKLSPSAVFRHANIALRELLLEARKSTSNPFELRQMVLYRGPLRQVIDDAGNVFERGQRTTVSSGIADLLRDGPLADSFIFFAPGDD